MFLMVILDINECIQMGDICANGRCENLIPGYRCICNTGYEADSSERDCSGISSASKRSFLVHSLMNYCYCSKNVPRFVQSFAVC